MIFSHTNCINWAAITCRQTLGVTAFCPCPKVWLWFTCFTCNSKFLIEVKMKYLCPAKQHSLFFPNNVLVIVFPWESKMICHITLMYRAPVCNTPNLFRISAVQMQAHTITFLLLFSPLLIKRLTRCIIMDFMSKLCTRRTI